LAAKISSICSRWHQLIPASITAHSKKLTKIGFQIQNIVADINQHDRIPSPRFIKKKKEKRKMEAENPIKSID